MTEPQISDEVFGAAAFAARRATASLLTVDQTLDVAHAVLTAAVPLLHQQWAAEQCPLESYTITTECRVNRGDDGAWDEAVNRLRAVYNAQLARFGPAAVYRVEFHREPAPGIPRYGPDGTNHCPAAGPRRNQEMVDSGLDLLIAFPGDRGTADMTERARRAGINVQEVGR